MSSPPPAEPVPDLARRLIADFLRRTGADGGRPPVRYLWTDAFAVCTLLAFHRREPAAGHLETAAALVDQVHRVLGRHRDDDAREGWISGLGEAAGEARPTAGGLRIGKKLPERQPGDAFDPRLEWERDGQYFHYLTRWMHALHQVGAVTGEGRYRRWARQLAAAAHRGFVRTAPDGAVRMVWKMSIDLRRPLVPSMGHHDPLDGLLTYVELATAHAGDGDDGGPGLDAEIADAEAMCAGGRWSTDDALGIGGLLLDVARLVQLRQHRDVGRGVLLERLISDARASLLAWRRADPLAHPPAHRLGFRELGLAIGLRAVELARASVGEAPALAPLVEHAAVAGRIERFWADDAHRRAATWSDHRDINEVMLATSLVPEGYVLLA